MDYFHEKFIENLNSGKDKFNPIILYDEKSLYYCKCAYKFFSELESKLRYLVLKIITRTFGNSWTKTLTLEQQNEIKKHLSGSNKNTNIKALASEAIYEMDLGMLISYLFDDNRETNPEEIIDYLSENIKNLSHTEIYNNLQKARKNSVWNKYFADIVKMDNPKADLEKIRIGRNKIAHIKHYSKNDFEDDKKLIRHFNSKINKALSAIDTVNITDDEKLISTEALKTVTKNFSDTLTSIDTTKYNKNIRTSLNEFSKMLSAIYNISKSMNAVSDIAKTLELTQGLPKSMSTVSEIAKAAKLNQKVSKSMTAVSEIAKAAELNHEVSKSMSAVSEIAKTAELNQKVSKSMSAVSEIAKTAELNQKVSKSMSAVSEIAKAAELNQKVSKSMSAVSEIAKTAELNQKLPKSMIAVSEIAKAAELNQGFSESMDMVTGVSKKRYKS